VGSGADTTMAVHLGVASHPALQLATVVLLELGLVHGHSAPWPAQQLVLLCCVQLLLLGTNVKRVHGPLRAQRGSWMSFRK